MNIDQNACVQRFLFQLDHSVLQAVQSVQFKPLLTAVQKCVAVRVRHLLFVI